MMKAIANRQCNRACADWICQEVGCLNQDGHTLRPRIKLLIKRLDKVKMRKSDYEEGASIPIRVINTPPNNVIRLEDYKKDE